MTSHESQPVGGHVLVVDDHASARRSIADVLQQVGYRVTACASAAEAIGLLGQTMAEVVVTDLQMPGMNGLDFIREIERRRWPCQVLMITAHASVQSAVEAMRHGAFDYLEKPFDVTQLERSVGQALDRQRLLHGSTSSSSDAPAIIGNSQAMNDLRRRLALIATTEETVLICGESGTGKELVAQAIHAMSQRREKPLVSLNCPVLSEQLIESELFGHRRGAFTGADADRTGRFELAQGGTFLLDEITEINLRLQAKLLRVLQERTFERVGSSEPIRADVRILATTNRDLASEVAAGRFREDLYYRLAVLPVDVPPLRDRAQDVLQLVDHFLDQAMQKLGRPRCDWEPDARQLLLDYHWPGNVRELQNVVTRACVLNQGRPIRADEIRPWLRWEHQSEPANASEVDLRCDTSLADLERKHIVATLEKFGGHRARTAAALGIGVRTLSGKLRDYGFAPREKAFADSNCL
ncbi:MAG: sigma-54 dependent transcriptional regulator [Pirellulales bacterium]